MKIIYIRLFLSILYVFSYSVCYSQTNNDTLKQILSSKTFTLEEEYIGDWGGHLYTFNFTSEGKSIRILWENPELVKNGKKLDVLLPITELKNLENIFIDCSTKIKTSKNGSTEHIFYKFKTKKLTYIIDDKFTMECHKEFKTWKEMLLLTGKQGKKKIDDWKILDKPLHYFIKYPPDWNLNETAKSFDFIISSPLEYKDDKFIENVKLTTLRFTGHDSEIGENKGITDEKFRLKNSPYLIENKKIKNDSIELYKLIFTENEKELHFKIMQYYWFIYDEIYILTFTVEQDKFEKFKKIGENILQSFTLKK